MIMMIGASVGWRRCKL